MEVTQDFQNADAPIAAKEIAQAIVKISQAMGMLLSSGLNRRALLVLLCDYTGVPKRQIAKVIDGLEHLKIEYCTPEGENLEGQ